MTKKYILSSSDYRKELEMKEVRYAESLSDPNGAMNVALTNLNNTDSTRVERMLSDPVTNFIDISNLMRALVVKNGTVGSTMRYFMSHLTYNHTIYSAANEKSGFDMSKGTMEDYLAAANYIDMYNIKMMAPYFVYQTLINGMSFFYEVKDSKGISYVEFPVSWGRISSQKNGVYRWELDVSQLNDDIIPYLPKEIQTAYEQQGSADEKKWREGTYYRLSDKGVAFCLDQSVMINGGIAISPFASLLIDSIQLEKSKKNVQIQDVLDTVRIVHAKIPLDKDSKPSINAKAANEYTKALNRGLPPGVVGITNPMALTNVPLNGSGNTNTYNMVDKAQRQLHLSTGTLPELFGTETKSSKIAEYSMRKDAAWLYTTVLPMLNSYYSQCMTGFKTQGNFTWKVKFLEMSNHFLKESVDFYKEEIANGGSRLDYLASLGKEPIESLNKLLMEQQVLNIDSIMVPKQTSHTLSGKDGRPETPNPTDDTTRIADSE